MGAGEKQDHAGEAAPFEGGAEAVTPRQVGDRLLSVTESIQRELDALRHVSAEQDAREQALSQREAALSERERKLAEAAEALRSTKAEMESREQSIAERERATEELSRDATAKLEDATLREAALEERERSAQALESELTERRARLEAAQQALEHAEKELAANTERLAAQKKVLREREQTVGERESTCDAREAEIAALQTSAASAVEAAKRIAALEAQLAESQQSRSDEGAELRVQLDAAQERQSELEARCRELEERLSQQPDGADVETLNAEIARRDEALGLMQERLKAAVERAEELESELASAREAAGGSAVESRCDDAINALRRERLRRMKALLEERARKVIRAREAIAQKAAELEQAAGAAEPATLAEQREQLEARAAEAEKVLAMRAALAERQAALEKQAKIVRRTAARSGAGVLMACFAIMLAVSAGAGWLLAGQFADATYVAQSTIGMDAAGGPPTAEQEQSWTSFHRALASDPQLIEKCAERMRRRGYAELGTAPALTAMIRENMEMEPGARGELIFSLRGQGQARTEAILDTFVGTVVQMGNDARDRRADGVAAVVQQGATSDPRPIADARLPMAGMIAGGLASLSSLAWLVAWRGLSKRSLLPPDELDAID